jgi:hypothetical protein
MCLLLTNKTHFIQSLSYLLQWHPEAQTVTVITPRGGECRSKLLLQLSLPRIFVVLNAFHTAYLSITPCRPNAHLCKFSTLRIIFILSCFSLRWPPFTRFPQRYYCWCIIHKQILLTLELTYIIISDSSCNSQSSVPIKHVKYMLQKEDRYFRLINWGDLWLCWTKWYFM